METKDFILPPRVRISPNQSTLPAPPQTFLTKYSTGSTRMDFNFVTCHPSQLPLPQTNTKDSIVINQ